MSNTQNQKRNRALEKPDGKAYMNRYIALSLALCLTGISCRQNNRAKEFGAGRRATASAIDPLAIALAPHKGSERLDSEIIRLQDCVRSGKTPEISLERLGWAFVAKARESFDPGYYKLAESCSFALESRGANRHGALLLRGHVLHNLHRFKEAEPLARELVAARGLPFDFGLLSDVLMEQGQIEDAIAACQRMIDLRPDLDSYARGAHLRWLKGNVAGAEKLMGMATTAASPRDPESAAWVNTRLAGYEFQLGDEAEAERVCEIGLGFRKDYPPALLLRGRMLLAQKKKAAAVDVLDRAAELNPLPEYQWTLAEALRADGREEQAQRVESELRQRGSFADPRTFSLFLATRGESVESALRLAKEELHSRGDVFTHDALAWALAANGKLEEASREIAMALAEGTQDGRLFYHAAMIAHKVGDKAQAQSFAAKAAGLRRLLLPCEKEQLESIDFPPAATVVAATGTDNKPKAK